MAKLGSFGYFDYVDCVIAFMNPPFLRAWGCQCMNSIECPFGQSKFNLCIV